MKYRALIFLLLQAQAFSGFCSSLPVSGIRVVEPGAPSVSRALALVREDKLLLEKAIESGKYGLVSSGGVVRIYGDLELSESCLSEMRTRLSGEKNLSRLREASEQLKKSKMSAARLNDIIKSRTGRGLYSALAALESDLGEVIAYLNGLRLSAHKK